MLLRHARNLEYYEFCKFASLALFLLAIVAKKNEFKN
jgi:hypothetical protein